MYCDVARMRRFISISISPISPIHSSMEPEHPTLIAGNHPTRWSPIESPLPGFVIAATIIKYNKVTTLPPFAILFCFSFESFLFLVLTLPLYSLYIIIFALDNVICYAFPTCLKTSLAPSPSITLYHDFTKLSLHFYFYFSLFFFHLNIEKYNFFWYTTYQTCKILSKKNIILLVGRSIDYKNEENQWKSFQLKL